MNPVMKGMWTEKDFREIVFDWDWDIHEDNSITKSTQTGECVVCNHRITTSYHCFRKNDKVDIEKHAHVHLACLPSSLLAALALVGREPDVVHT